MSWVPGEALRNLLSGTTHALRHSLLLSAILGALVVAELMNIDSLLTRSAAYANAGGSVLVLEAPGQVDGAACEAIGELPGVNGAGSLREEDSRVVIPALPRAPLATYSVTAGLLDVIDAGDDLEPGIALSADIASALHLKQGDELITATGPTRVRGTFDWPEDGRRRGLGYAALIPTTTQDTFDQCWVRAWPMPQELSALIRLTLLPGDDQTSPVTVSALNGTLAASFDGESQYLARVTGSAWIAASLAGLVMGFSSVRTRRLELAAARHIGVTPAAQHIQLLSEATAWVAATAVTLLAATASTIALSSGIDDSTLLAAAAHIAVPGMISALLGSQLATATIHEKSLFRYFKTRQ